MVTILKGSRRARVGDELVKLTRTEFEILLKLAPGRVLEEHGEPLRSQMCRLRKKLGPDQVETLSGVGYRLIEPAQISNGIE